MSYNTMALMAKNFDLRDRLIACAAKENKPGPSYEAWVSERIWRIVTAPDWDNKWASALISNPTNIGKNELVISDDDILAVIQNMD